MSARKAVVSSLVAATAALAATGVAAGASSVGVSVTLAPSRGVTAGGPG